MSYGMESRRATSRMAGNSSLTFHAAIWPFPDPSLLVSFFTSIRRISGWFLTEYHRVIIHGKAVPSLTSSRSLGSVGLPLEEGMIVDWQVSCVMARVCYCLVSYDARIASQVVRYLNRWERRGLSAPGDPCRFCSTEDLSGGWLERQQTSGEGQTGLTREIMATLSLTCPTRCCTKSNGNHS